jgi:MOSC domain-containing protein YiiM/phosphohistidine swiveling domain-containing protein
MQTTGEARGTGVSPGVGRGELHVDIDDALDAIDERRPVVLALETSSPADVVAMTRAAAIVAVHGDAQSHTAIVANEAGVPAVVGVPDLRVTATGIAIGADRIAPGTPVTVDGTSGLISWEASPPKVVGIQLAKATRLGMQSVDSAEIETAAGLVGDRYHGSKHRQLSVQSLSELADAEAKFGHPIDPLLTRRNVTIDEGEIPRTPGHRWRVGEIELEVVRDAAPCKMLDMEIGDGARTAMRRRAGVICRVVAGGTLTLGDPVTLGDSATP